MAAAPLAPMRSATSAAADGVWYGCVTVATMTMPTWSGEMPALASAAVAASLAMSTTLSSWAA